MNEPCSIPGIWYTELGSLKTWCCRFWGEGPQVKHQPHKRVTGSENQAIHSDHLARCEAPRTRSGRAGHARTSSQEETHKETMSDLRWGQWSSICESPAFTRGECQED